MGVSSGFGSHGRRRDGPLPRQPKGRVGLRETLGVAQGQTALDPFEPVLDPVDSARLTGKVTMQVGNFATEVSDRHFQGGQASLDVLHVHPELAELRSNGAQVLKNRIVSLVGHDGFFVRLYVSVNQSKIAASASGLAQPQSVLDPLQTTFDT